MRLLILDCKTLTKPEKHGLFVSWVKFILMCWKTFVNSVL